MIPPHRLLDVGERAVLVELDSELDAGRLAAALLARPPAGVEDVVGGARTVLVTFDPRVTTAARLAPLLTVADDGPERPAPGGVVDLPTVYDGADLAAVAELTQLSVAEVVRRHTAARYTVGFIGFAPGFAYLIGGDPALRVPRRATPRPAVPAGSVALADHYTGVYPRCSPGGWQLLGRTAVALWDVDVWPPARLAPGTEVRFRAVDGTPGS